MRRLLALSLCPLAEWKVIEESNETGVLVVQGIVIADSWWGCPKERDHWDVTPLFEPEHWKNVLG